jgi:hypothetical protein
MRNIDGIVDIIDPFGATYVPKPSKCNVLKLVL